MKKLFIVAVSIPLLIAFIAIGVKDIYKQKNVNEHIDIQLDQREIRLNNLRQEMLKLDTELDQQKGKADQDQQKIQQLEEEKQRLERELQAKLERQKQETLAQAKLQEASKPATARATASPSVSGNKETWLRASGIPESQWWAVDSIVTRESGWNPNAVNKSSGACGLGQQLPCGKWAGAWNDPVAALKAQYKYVIDRYGGYPQAVAFWNANHWY